MNKENLAIGYLQVELSINETLARNIVQVLSINKEEVIGSIKKNTMLPYDRIKYIIKRLDLILTCDLNPVGTIYQKYVIVSSESLDINKNSIMNEISGYINMGYGPVGAPTIEGKCFHQALMYKC